MERDYCSMWLHECKTRTKKRYDFNAFEDPTEKEKLIGETAYRRGYMQGFVMASMAVQAGVLFPSMNAFAYGPLMKWREKKHEGLSEVPPQIVNATKLNEKE